MNLKVMMKSRFRKEIIGDATLYLGDCLDILPTLGNVDAVVTDPPYGIGESRGKNKSRSRLAEAKDYGFSNWDDSIPDNSIFQWIHRFSASQIIFGGNYFDLGKTSCFLVWDKLNGDSDFADCELAWTNLKKAVRIFRFKWQGMLQGDMKNKQERVHPTQKPIQVMEWCLMHIPNAKTILDPFMGSGTTGVACYNLGRKFIGIEIDEKYFDIACKRIETAHKQRKLFPDADEATERNRDLF